MILGDIVLKNDIFLAPMAGITDISFRSICREMGAGITYTEMVSAKALYYNNKKSEELLKTADIEVPVGVQIFGNDPGLMASEAKKIECGFDIIDVNMGCPVPKVVRNGEGSALMKDPELCGRIVKKLVDTLNKPVSVKIRKGFNDENINAELIAKIAEDNGASLITVHGRTREEYYSGKADYDIIRKVKSAAGIPVVGNGDIFSIEDADRMRNETGCDGIMVARGVLGNPWLIKELVTGARVEVSIKERADMILRHADMVISDKGENIGIKEMRKHVVWYIKNIKNAARIRESISRVSSYEELKKMLSSLLESTSI